MEDHEIINLYWERKENAISATAKNTANIVMRFPTIFYIARRTQRNVSMIPI